MEVSLTPLEIFEALVHVMSRSTGISVMHEKSPFICPHLHSLMLYGNAGTVQNWLIVCCCHHITHNSVDVYTRIQNWLKGIQFKKKKSFNFVLLSLTLPVYVIYTIYHTIWRIWGVSETTKKRRAYLKSEHCGLTNILYKQSFITIHILQGRISLHCSGWGWKDGWEWVLQTFLEC